MRNAQKPDHISLNTLIGWIREGRFVVPDFQREFEWRPWDIQELMRSIFLDYYIGSLLLWKGKAANFSALTCEPIYGYPGPGRPELIVLDGQQRLTAMHYAFFAPQEPLPGRTKPAVYFIHVDHFMAGKVDEAFSYDWRTRRMQRIYEDRHAQFLEHIFPLDVIGQGGWELPNWVQGYEQFWKDKAQEARASGDDPATAIATGHAVNAKEFGVLLKGITEQYQITYIELDQDLEVDKICDIFTQINSRGVRLDIFDLVNALLKPRGLQLKQLWRDAARHFEFVDSEKMNVYVLQIMSILLQGYCSPKYLYFLLPGQEKSVRDADGTNRKEVLVRDTADFERRWHQAVKALEDAINLLRHPQEFGAISDKYLPYVSILPVFSALQQYATTCPPHLQLDAQRKIRHWYWASVFTNRYSGSVESTSSRDFLDVRGWIVSDTAEPSLIDEFKTRFKGLDLRREVKRGTSVYNGIFNLLVLAGARDWLKGTIPQHDDLDDHHIVPASWGEHNLEGNKIHTILNRTPLTASTNRHMIGDKLPNEYLRDLIARNGETRVDTILSTHFISPVALAILLRNPFTPDDFEAFISERQRTIQDAIEDLLIKERLDLSPNLRDIDADVERVELLLREVVSAGLGSDPLLLPQHVLQKIEERVQRAAKKNAALDIDQYQTLPGKLEYCDLREVLDTIVSKTLWPRFESRFANKETLAAKFDQMAELRNGIRHSRTVDAVTMKEGEAALIWFKLVLAK